MSGWFPAGGDFAPLTPVAPRGHSRGTKVGNAAGTGCDLGGAGAGTCRRPGHRAQQLGDEAVSLNVTVTEGESPSVGGGYVTVFPCGTRPEASNLNFVAGRTVANAVWCRFGGGHDLLLRLRHRPSPRRRVRLPDHQPDAFFVTDDAGNPLPTERG